MVIDEIPTSAKLVVLVGPNGCGKSSLFDAFKCWQLFYGFSNGVLDSSYYTKEKDSQNYPYQNISIYFDNQEKVQNVNTKYKEAFYFRTAYRNDPDFTTNGLSRITDIYQAEQKKMIDNDATVRQNYERLVSKTLVNVFSKEKDDMKVSELREELIGKINKSMQNLFEDLILSGIGNPLSDGSFYFRKGVVNDFHYKNLSGGEKATFDIILDLIIKSEYYRDAIYCIDEPETHIHTKLQSKLLNEMFNLVPDNSQLWIATHSLGMMRKAKELNETNPGCVVFLDFDNCNFDNLIVLKPVSIDKPIWEKFLSLAVDEYSSYITPRTIIFCEGNSRGIKNKDFDAKCYTKIFQNEFPDVGFYSLGSCNDVEDEKNRIIEAIKAFAPNSKIVRLIDRDDRSAQEIQDLRSRGIKVLSLRHIEAYLLDD